MKLNKPLTSDTTKAKAVPKPKKKQKRSKKPLQIHTKAKTSTSSIKKPSVSKMKKPALPKKKQEKKAREKTPLEKEYFKQRRRVQSQLSRMRKAGYNVSGIEVPKIPKKITTGSVSRLRTQFSTKKLYEKSSYEMDGQILGGDAAKVRLARMKREAAHREKMKRAAEVTAAPKEPKTIPEPLPEPETEPLDEVQFLLDKVRENIDFINNLPDKASQYYRIGSELVSAKDEVVKTLNAHYRNLVASCLNKAPLPENVFEELKTLANDEFFSQDFFGYEDENAADQLGFKMVQLANKLQDKSLKEQANALANEDQIEMNGDEFVSISEEDMKQYGWMFNDM